MRGITPVIAIIVLLLITIAIAGGAWTFMSTLTTGYTSKVIQTVDSFCSGDGYAVIALKNVGTDPITIADYDIHPDIYDGAVAIYHFEGNADDDYSQMTIPELIARITEAVRKAFAQIETERIPVSPTGWNWK